ncbi:aminodeoxychorismate lyase [Sporosarcina sp. JAI121]|uniref:aminodeoxychorismate lyase n=1 Tax=Sporosarcina sp. JAI121 TaxID=2723064 RepID=UPI0015CE96EB|nr:aminodeoxychorismate lyase [Sporosarcina sp. JAI121]NYF26438.1 4-amino-4-deoxychorismate lyase [Sporosarcina sp. JAI121]
MWCWMNGEYLRAEELKISPFDHGFLYGAGFFETFRTYEGDVFLYDEHMDRLNSALKEYRIEMPYNREEILAAIRRLDELSGCQDGYFRLNVSAGVHDIGLAPSSYTSPNVILFRKELASTVRGTEKRAVWLDTPRNQPESAVRHKSHNFLNNVRGRLELPSLKEIEGLFVTAQGFVAEGVTSNVFWVRDGALFTPAIETGILPGTTRAFVIECAKSDGIVVDEGFYGKGHVEGADELFVTNAVQELVPLSMIEETRLPGASGVYYKKLHEKYIQALNQMKEGSC